MDRIGGRPIMLVGALVLSSSLFAVSQVNELWQWLLLRGVLFAVGAAMVGNLVVSVTLSRWFVERRSQAIAWAAMGVSLAAIVWPTLMNWIIEQSDWRAGWQVLAVFAFIALVPASWFMRRSPEDYGLHPDGRSSAEVERGMGSAAELDYRNSLTRRQAVRTRAFYLVVLAFGLSGLGIGVIFLHNIRFLQEAGFSAGTAALMSSIMSVPALLSKPLWGWLAARRDPARLASVASAMAGVATLIILAGAHAGMLWLLIAGYLMLGSGFGSSLLLQETIWGSYFGRRYLGSVRSVAMPAALALGAGGPQVASIYVDFVGSYDGVFLAVAALWWLSALLLLFIRRPATPPARGELVRASASGGDSSCG
jgi:MFS family permease